MKRIIKKLIIYSIIGVVITLTPLYYVNNVLLSENTDISEEKKGSFIVNALNLHVKLPEGAEYVSRVHDTDYVTYVNKGNIYIKNIKNDKLVKEINELNPVVYAAPIDNGSIVMYFVYANGRLYIKTYDIARDESADHKAFPVKNFYRIDDVKYSKYTNVIYVNVETKAKNEIQNNIYRINIMKTVSIAVSNKKIDAVNLLNNEDVLVYEDYKNNVYINNRLFKYGKENKFKLLGVDEDDNLYLMSMEDAKTIYVVKDERVSYQMNIDDTSYEDVYSKDNRIYLVYKDHVYDLINQKNIRIKPDVKIIDISDSTITYVDSQNLITEEDI
ncbi:hypothetical protein [Fonticella tunisiensis]|uniref:Uncharacterized protein n=1 Tax=Fonticella tunisiensis TaxID=1096341 RepID=A0A4R7K9P5_9CLOT|nr:hypothetical protein [Fonticella tunisiensis]TDT50811.1 hypothetical protein EDD71_12424 [Fonticella tunisiensis]